MVTSGVKDEAGSLGTEQWGLLFSIDVGKCKVNVWLQRVPESGCLYRNNRWPVLIMLVRQRLCVEQVSTACFSNSLPSLCIFYFVVCLVYFWLPQDVQVLQDCVTCNSRPPPPNDWAFAKNSSKMVSLLFFLAHKHAFSSKLFSSLYTCFYLRTFTPIFSLFYKHINCVTDIYDLIYLFFLCMIT